MEETGALRPIPLLSRPHSQDGKLFKTREEGEVISDEDAFPACSSAPSVSVSDSVFPSNTTYNFGGRSSVQGVKSGKSNFANHSGSADIQSRTSLQIGTLKGFSKHQEPLKLSTWYKPLEENTNLVISFSDDESGSDTDQQETGNACETDRRTQVLPGVTRSIKPPSLPPIMDTTMKIKSNEQKVLPKKFSMSHTLAPSIPRSNIPKPKSIWPSVVEQRPRLTNSNLASRNSAIRGSGRSKSVDLSDNKLQDLRQQIALRENELKLKTLQQKRENISEGCRDFYSINQSKSAPRRPRDIAPDVRIEVKEPDAKRKKLSQDGSGRSIKEHNEKSTENKSLTSKEPPTKCNNLQDVGLVDPGHHDGHIAQTELVQGSMRMQLPGKRVGRGPSSSAGPKANGQDAPAFSASCSLSDWVSKSRSNLVVSDPIPAVADMPVLSLPKTSSTVSVRANQSGRENGIDPSTSGKQTSAGDTTKCNDQLDAQEKADRLNYDSNLHVHSIQTSPNDPSTSDQRHAVTNQGYGGTDIQLLFATEEFHDKQLEKAQEHRHRCEIEERNALKAYHKARRALAEANAQCTYLYRKRELFSARLSSFVMDNPALILPSQKQEHFGDLWNFSNNVSEVNLDLITSATDQIQAEHDAGNQVGYESNVQSADGDLHHRFSPNVDGNNLGSAACSEPDVSTSELLPRSNKETANGLLSPSNDLNVSSDEFEEIYPLQGKKDNIGESTMLPVDKSRDSVLLEEYLRSKLFSRLETITSRRIGVGEKHHPDGIQMASDNISSQPEKEQYCEYRSASGDQQDLSAEERCKDGERSENVQLRIADGLHSDVTETQNPDLGGFDVAEPSSYTHQEAEEHGLVNSENINHRGADDHECRRPQSTDVKLCVLLSSIFKSAFSHIKCSYSPSYNDVCIFSQRDGVCYPSDNIRVDCTEESVNDGLVGVIDSSSNNYLIDPDWPLCMYELRGRCNNDECPWQHVGDHPKRNLQQKSPSSVDSVTGSSSNSSNLKVGEPSRALTPPAYLVCVNSLIADSLTHNHTAERKCGPFQQKILSSSLVVPSLLHKHGCTENCGSPDRQSLDFESRNDKMTLLQNDLPDKNQVLETALLILNQETDKPLGIRKALELLSRGLEADPTSLHKWVVYLLIYYNDRDTVGDVELFTCAVKNNKGSYELWLMYIKSCRLLKDQLSAYDTALSNLCCHARAHALDIDATYTSACILDLLLQMLHCLCMSGNVDTVAKRIHRLTDGMKDPDTLLLLDILQCLGDSDKCVFWVSCAYFVIYKKLPDAIVGMFEFEKDAPLIDWPSVHISSEEKQLVYKLMEMATEKSWSLRAAQLLALNHVKLVAAIDNIESCMVILEKYIVQYPSCLEFALLAARICTQKCEGNSFLGFEQALNNWPKELPGIQCIWNQFGEYALENDSLVGKEIMLRWYDSVANKDNCDENNRELTELFNFDCSESKPGSVDATFGLLNLSLHELLQKDVKKAYLAADKALKTAKQEFRHCLKEHAMFLLNHGSQVDKDVSLAGLLDMLKSYISYRNKSPASAPLTDKFIQQVPKPRERQLIYGLLSPISPEFSTVNLVLETWFGPSLLPQKLSKIKELVDFVEAVLELSPCNYPFTIMTCKLLLQKEIDSASTSYWASSLLINTIYQSVPVPPEYVWVETAGLLIQMRGIEASVTEDFHQRALSVHPFSMKLWMSFLLQTGSDDSRKSILEAAKERGIELPIASLGEKGVEATKDKQMEDS